METSPLHTQKQSTQKTAQHSSNRQLQTTYWQKQLIPDPWKKLL